MTHKKKPETNTKRTIIRLVVLGLGVVGVCYWQHLTPELRSMTIGNFILVAMERFC